MLTSINTATDWYEEEHTPPFDYCIIDLARRQSINLEGVCKVTVSFLRDPLTAERLYTKNIERLQGATHGQSEQLDLSDPIF